MHGNLLAHDLASAYSELDNATVKNSDRVKAAVRIASHMQIFVLRVRHMQRSAATLSILCA